VGGTKSPIRVVKRSAPSAIKKGREGEKSRRKKRGERENGELCILLQKKGVPGLILPKGKKRRKVTSTRR